MSPWLGMAAFLAAAAALAAGLRLWQRRAGPPPELPRKAMHVGLGLLVLPFPWMFHEPWPVLALAGVSMVGLLALRVGPVLRAGPGQLLHGVSRESLGELCFPVAVALVFVLARGDRLLFAIPMLTLALADAVAALIGLRHGRHRYRTADGKKSWEGSLAFLAVSFLCAWVPLRLWSPMTLPAATLAAALMSGLVMLIEAASWRGLDNLFTPLLTFALVAVFRRLTGPELAVRLGVLAGVAAFLFASRRRTTLDTGALMGAALFLYVCGVLGGAAWLVAPAVFFAAHALLWPRGRRELPSYDARAAFSVALPGLVMLLAHVLGRPAGNGTAYAAMLAVIGADRMGGNPSPSVAVVRTLAWSAAGFIIVWLPAEMLSAGRIPALSLGPPLGILAGALVYPAVDRRAHLAPPWTHRTVALSGLVASAVALWR
jgi:phytol kinase